jgi:hypothetical protein
MQQHRHANIGNKLPRELVAPSQPLDRNGASHLATPTVSLNPVLEDELNPLRERDDAVRNDGCAAAMQPADEVRDLVQLN